MAGPAALALLAAVQASMASGQPPRAVPFDCSWIYHPPSGARERFEGVYYSFIDNGGFVACGSAKACNDWMGKGNVEIAFSDRASAQLRRRSIDLYGVYRIVFEGRRGKLGTRPGCESNEWSLERRDDDYVRVERVLSVKRL
jgi:hypothetical protein